MAEEGSVLVAKAKATIGAVNYATEIAAGHHKVTADEPPALGGGGTGPGPFDLLLSSLGACTAITLKMYAGRKQWPVEEIGVDLRYFKTGEVARIERKIALKGALTDEQRARMADIAERTPVTLALKGGVGIRTELV